MKLEKYRPTMSSEVLRSWAEDAQVKIDALTEVVEELSKALKEKYGASPEGRKYLAKMEAALNS